MFEEMFEEVVKKIGLQSSMLICKIVEGGIWKTIERTKVSYKIEECYPFFPVTETRNISCGSYRDNSV